MKKPITILCFLFTAFFYAQDYKVMAEADLKLLAKEFEQKKQEFEKEKLTLDGMYANLDPNIQEQIKKTKKLKDELDAIYNKQKKYKSFYKDHGVKEKDLESFFNDPKGYKTLDAKVEGSKHSESELKLIHKNLTFFNGCNFDFNDTKNKTGYVGNINLFIDVNDKWFINSGLRKINYSSDINNSSPRYQIDNLRIKPLDEITVGKKYLQEYNKYNSTVKIGSWSAYFQLMRKVTKDIYFHLHTELLVSDVNYTTEINTIQRDTLEAIAPMEIGYRNQSESKFERKETYFGFYAGVGVTGKFTVIETDKYNLNYFIQGTYGFTNNQLNPTQAKNKTPESPISNPLYNPSDYVFNLDPKKKSFCLLHTNISNDFNGLNIIIGTEIRGIFTQPPLYIFYVGLNTDLNKIGELF